MPRYCKLIAFLCLFLCSIGLSKILAQGVAAPHLINRSVDESRLVRLFGNVHPLARGEFDQGLVSSSLSMNRMLLVLKRSPGQEAALETFMAAQYNPKSPNFHRWLTPEEFGDAYGPSDSDLQVMTNWLENQGLTVDSVTKGRTFIEFSGTAAAVQRAFHTEIHRYSVNGEEHIGNSTDPSIPEALSPVISGVFSLNDFFSRPLHRDLGMFRRDPKTRKWVPDNEDIVTKPLFGVATGNGTFELISPYDFATIYNLLPLWNAGIDGTGQTIAIAGRSDISLSDVATFRSAFGLPANPPTIIVNGTDPGVPSAGDKAENTLDVEWSGAVAKGAKIKFVTTASTATSDGAVASAIYIIENNVAPVMSFSYGNCELAYGSSGNTAINSIWQQGASQGITEFVASGDQGSAACDGGHNAPYAAESGLQVSGSSSTPYDVAVGGTDLNWVNSSTTYWNSTNASNGSSALGYIPEVPWNGTCVSDAVDQLVGGTGLGFDEEQTCEALLQQGVGLNLINATGGTGGKSSCTTPSSSTPASCSGGYAKPSWQVGTGVPADGKRDVPDVSLFASSGALNTAYVICDSQSTPCTFSNANDALAQGVGGTSVASPAMAGIMALINQKMGSAQGNANVAFYALAARDNRGSCDTNTVQPGNGCNFFDVTTDNNAVPCAPASPDCTVHHTGDQVGVLNGYTAGTGYDLASGLGSVNAGNLVNNWHLVVSSTIAPSVATGASGSITSSGASVSGTVNPNGSDTKGWFQYGTNSQLSAATSTAMQDLGSGKTNVALNATLGGLSSNTKYYFRAVASNSAGTVNGSISSFTTSGSTTTGSALQYVPVTPCRIADTRNATGPFGGPELAADSTREFDIPHSGCAIPSSAVAYSLNVTVVPNAALGYLSLWPSGVAQPVVSTLNSDGRIKANAAIVGAGTNGGVSVFVSDASNVILDIDGYFVPSGTTSALAFYPATPCRIADTRNAAGPLGGPYLTGGHSRSFPVQSSNCGLPANAQAYSLNVTAVPHQGLGYLTTWPTGQTQPLVSTLNSPTGVVTANAAVVPAGTGGAISIYVSNDSDVVLDVNGYFAPPSTAGLSLYTMTPCRVIDTRPGAFTGTRPVNVAGSACAPPRTAQSYVLNATVVPDGSLGYLTLWPDGESQPLVSTLNAVDGALTSNMAIVPTNNGSVDAFAQGDTNLILDISGYFAP